MISAIWITKSSTNSRWSPATKEEKACLERDTSRQTTLEVFFLICCIRCPDARFCENLVRRNWLSKKLCSASSVSFHTKQWYRSIYSSFQNCARCVKDLKDNKHRSLHLGRKLVGIFVLGHDLFLEAHSFPRAALWKTVRFSEQRMSADKYLSIFSRQMETIIFISRMQVCQNTSKLLAKNSVHFNFGQNF